VPRKPRPTPLAAGGIAPKEIAEKRERWERLAGIVIAGTRRDLGVSQPELATRLGWTRNMVANIESSRRSARLSDLFLIARALNISPETLLLRIIHWEKRS